MKLLTHTTLMARIEPKRPEQIKGKIGNVVACTWRGIPYLRTLPAHVKNPRTPMQQAQRTRFSVALSLLRPLTPVLRIGFHEGTVHQSAFNAAMSYTMRYALKETAEGIAVDYRNTRISRGTLTGATEAVVVPGEGKAVFTWNNNCEIENASPRDHALTVVYHKPSQTAVYETMGTLRDEGRAELNYPKDWRAEDLAIYLGFWNPKEKMASISECLWGGE